MTCDNVWVGGYDVSIICILPTDHEGSHKSHIGQQWDEGVDW